MWCGYGFGGGGGRGEFYLEVCPHLVCQTTQTDASEEVDGEAHVARCVLGEDAGEPECTIWVLQPVVQALQAHVLRKILPNNHHG